MFLGREGPFPGNFAALPGAEAQMLLGDLGAEGSEDE
jgi:hypothetical protein